MAPDQSTDTYWRTQLYVALWPLWLVLYVPFAVVSLTDASLPAAVTVAAGLPMLLAGVAFFVAHFGFALDGHALRKSDSSWRPWWILYFLASFLVGPFIVAPIYLLRRRQRTGRPNMADVKRKASLRGLFVPWH